jgi:hypothetical protein
MTRILWLLFAIILLSVTAVGVRVYRVYRSSPNVDKTVAPPVTTAPATTTLSVDVANARVSGTSLEIPIAIDTGGNTVSIVELHLGFDATLLTGVSIQPGSFFSNPMIIENKVDQNKGTIVMTLSSLTPRQGTGPLATISATAVQKTSVTFHIDPKTKVAAIGEKGNVLRSTSDDTVQIP